MNLFEGNSDLTDSLNVTEDESFILKKYSEEEKKVIHIVSVCQQALAITTDASNNYAREVGKQASDLIKAINKRRLELTKPLRDEETLINSVAKKLTAPLEEQVGKLRLAVTRFEMEKERKRQEEIRQQEEIKQQRELAEKVERERIMRIKNEIQKVQNSAFAEIERIEDAKSLTAFETKIKNWKPKEEFFAEFMPELTLVLNEIAQRIESRKSIITEMQRAKAEAERLKGVAKLQAEREAELKRKELEAQKLKEQMEERQRQIDKEKRENMAIQELTYFVASLGLNTNIEEKVKELVKTYGSAILALGNQTAIIEKINKERIEAHNKAILEAQKVKNQRTDYLFNVLDEAKVPREFLSVDETKIRKAIQDNRKKLEQDIASFTIEGIEIYPQTKTIFK